MDKHNYLSVSVICIADTLMLFCDRRLLTGVVGGVFILLATDKVFRQILLNLRIVKQQGNFINRN